MKLVKLASLALIPGIILVSQRAATLADPPHVPQANAAIKKVRVVFSGGHETEARDRGRPVVLIAAALHVPPAVFREAFSHVHPAPPGEQPHQEDVRRNKGALLEALAPYGVTNERLDEVSNYYRYRRDQGELWPTQEATALAIFKNGKLVGFEITGGGSGYSSAPGIAVPGLKQNALHARLSFNQDFDSNGAVASIAFATP